MVKTKRFKEEGQIIEIEEEKLPVMEITQNQAKKLTKKPLSEKQQANINKLVEANRQKWAIKKAKQDEKQSEEEPTNKVRVVVKPKRIYPSRKKAQVYETESETEPSEEESEEEVKTTYQKPKAKANLKRSFNKSQSEEIKTK